MATGEQESVRPLAASLAEGQVRWMAGGPLSDWVPTYGARHAQVAGGGQGIKVALTRADAMSGDRAVGEWRRWQRQFVQVPERATTDETAVWWRLAVHQRVFALCAAPCPDIDTAAAMVRRIIRRASRLTVVLAHRPGQAVPDWVVLDRETPVFMGLPGYPLAGVLDREDSLVTMLGTARFHRYVHDIHDRGTNRAPVVMSPRIDLT